MSPAFFYFFLVFLRSALVNLSLVTLHAPLSYILGPVLLSFAPSLLLYWCQSIFDRGISQNDSYFLLLFYILALFAYGLGRFGTSSGVAGFVQLL
jgi:hypothetical protein